MILSGAFLIEHGGEIIVHDGYGLADFQTAEPITADTIFEIGSVTQIFMAAGK